MKRVIRRQERWKHVANRVINVPFKVKFAVATLHKRVSDRLNLLQIFRDYKLGGR